MAGSAIPSYRPGGQCGSQLELSRLRRGPLASSGLLRYRHWRVVGKVAPIARCLEDSAVFLYGQHGDSRGMVAFRQGEENGHVGAVGEVIYIVH